MRMGQLIHLELIKVTTHSKVLVCKMVALSVYGGSRDMQVQIEHQSGMGCVGVS